MLRSRKCLYRWRETSSQLPAVSYISKDQTGRLRAACFVFARSESLRQSISLLAMVGFFGSDACDLRRLPFFNSR